ncbi:MAG: hemerythrin family protein [Nitrospirota bacterium]
MEKFTQELVIGVEAIDNQHREIFMLFNNLQEAVEQKKASANIEEIFRFLDNYVNTHFSTEEEYMQKYAYPAYDVHRAQHEKFFEELAGKKHDYLKVGEAVRTDMVVWLYFWFRKHILSVDKRMGEFLKSKIEARA